MLPNNRKELTTKAQRHKLFFCLCAFAVKILILVLQLAFVEHVREFVAAC